MDGGCSEILFSSNLVDSRSSHGTQDNFHADTKFLELKRIPPRRDPLLEEIFF